MLHKEITWKFTLADVGKFLVVSPVAVIAVYCLLLLPWEAEGASGWVQAFGSVIAIVAAGFFPIWHSSVMQKERETRLLELMRVLADEGLESMWLLSNTFVLPEHEVSNMRAYLEHHRQRDWEPLLASLGQVPVAEIPPAKASEFGKMLNAVQFGANVASLLPKWIEEGSSHPGVLETFRAKRALLSLIRAGLPVPHGVKDEIVDAQARGQGHERFIPPYTIAGFKVYRRYYWYHVREGDFPRKVMIQVVPPHSGGDHPWTIIHGAPRAGWPDIYRAEDSVREVVGEYIDACLDEANQVDDLP
ncbi:hypothetical protein [Metapseudomonas sp. CR1201]